jgi:hypothetical protein
MKLSLPANFAIFISISGFSSQKGGKVEHICLNTWESNLFWFYAHIVDANESNKANFMTYENSYIAVLCLCRELTHEWICVQPNTFGLFCACLNEWMNEWMNEWTWTSLWYSFDKATYERDVLLKMNKVRLVPTIRRPISCAFQLDNLQPGPNLRPFLTTEPSTMLLIICTKRETNLLDEWMKRIIVSIACSQLNIMTVSTTPLNLANKTDRLFC